MNSLLLTITLVLTCWLVFDGGYEKVCKYLDSKLSIHEEINK